MILIGLLVISLFSNISSQELSPPCDTLFCTGPLIDLVMTMRVFNDSKTFVDLKLKQSPNDTMKLFNEFMAQHNNNQPSKEELEAWLFEHFEPPGSELMEWSPSDFKDNPEVLNKIRDKNYKKFASDLNRLWIDLSRKMKDEVEVKNIFFENLKLNFKFIGKTRIEFDNLCEKSIRYCWWKI
jgi:alpha,alpha-trehalase